MRTQLQEKKWKTHLTYYWQTNRSQKKLREKSRALPGGACQRRWHRLDPGPGRPHTVQGNGTHAPQPPKPRHLELVRHERSRHNERPAHHNQKKPTRSKESPAKSKTKYIFQKLFQGKSKNILRQKWIYYIPIFWDAAKAGLRKKFTETTMLTTSELK